MPLRAGRETWITGIGLVSSLGEGLETHWTRLTDPAGVRPVVDDTLIAPFPVHPMVALDLDNQIPRKSDQRQMEPWQRTGTYAAGLALQGAGVKGNPDLLSRTHMIVAAGAGERDIAVDESLMAALANEGKNGGRTLNERLSGELRPTLFLAQLSNLLAGSISIVHGVTGSSRTILGEEAAGVHAIQIASRRIEAEQGDIFLVGGASNAERKDVALLYGLGGVLWRGEYKPLWARAEAGGGAILGSLGAFLVLEAREHAEKRGAVPFARIAGMASGRSEPSTAATADGAIRLWRTLPALGGGELPIVSGASGAEPAGHAERAFLGQLAEAGRPPCVRAIGGVLGHAVDAQFPASIAVAALALCREAFFPPFDPTGFEAAATADLSEVLVTSFGLWRGQALGLLARVG